MAHELATGFVVSAFGNLLHVRFEGAIRQGEVAYVHLGEEKLLAEVIEIAGGEAKMQVFEDTRGIKAETRVHFMGHLLEAELGPGLLTSIFDGLQNPLETVAEQVGVYLTRGVYLPPLNREKLWEFIPIAKPGDLLSRGDAIGYVMEGRFQHLITVPFSFFGKVRMTFVASRGDYSITTEVGKGEDEKGKSFSFTMIQRWPVKNALIEGMKISPTRMMKTGLRTLDTQFPVLKGGTFCSPGPFGAGKTVIQHHLSKYSEVDIVVIVACGERAGEVVEVLRTFPELIDEQTKAPLMKRTVIIGNTSSMPVAAREASVYMGATIAEYYRQMGLDVLLLADSTSRWAQAMREMSGRLEEIPGEEAFPAYLASRISAFYERAGAIELRGGKVGSLTIGGSVSPAGGNFEEPVTQASLAIVGAFHGLSRARSDARRYPAIEPLISWTKYLEIVGKELASYAEGWAEKVRKAAFILRRGDEIGKRMEVVGEEGISLEDLILFLKADLYDFCYLQQNAFDLEDHYTPLERQVEMFLLMQRIFDTAFQFSTHDAARTYFLGLQNALRNINFLSFRSHPYKEAVEKLQGRIAEGGSR
ncbi:MAG: V-type ATP synthase subunit A [Verrucomicrobiota bacterium]|nr:V-type ATP synthase subunit A [Verrucomicrobiota bacterium]